MSTPRLPRHATKIVATLGPATNDPALLEQLINHKVSSKRDEQKREQQFAERMLMGPRLTADLLSLQRKAK